MEDPPPARHTQKVLDRLLEPVEQEFGDPLQLDAYDQTNWTFLDEFGEDVAANVHFLITTRKDIADYTSQCSEEAICLNNIGE